jgi:protein MpaA
VAPHRSGTVVSVIRTTLLAAAMVAAAAACGSDSSAADVATASVATSPTISGPTTTTPPTTSTTTTSTTSTTTTTSIAPTTSTTTAPDIPATIGPLDLDAERVGLGLSAGGRPIVAERFGTVGGRRVLVIGVIHGDEDDGVAIVEDLRANPVPDGVELWIVESMNPDGQANQVRSNDNGVDLNRNFPYKYRGFK